MLHHMIMSTQASTPCYRVEQQLQRKGMAWLSRIGALNASAIPAVNGDLAFMPMDAEQCGSPGHSVSVNVMQNLEAPDKHRGAGRPTNSREKAPYEGLSKRTRFCSICRREGHKKMTCPERGDAPKKLRKPGKCKNCGIEGHRRNTCKRPLGFSEH